MVYIAEKHHPAALNLNDVRVAPSFYAHILNAVFLLIAAVLLYKNFPVIKRLDPFKLITLILLISVAVGVHGITHLGLESVYDFNPLKRFIQ